MLRHQRIEFQDEHGEWIIKDGKHRKSFRHRRPDPDKPGKWIYNADGVPPIPYRLPDLIEAISGGHPVLVVEDEAKADLLRSWNIAATCCVGGAKKWSAEHSKALAGANVYLLPDNDEPGWQHINTVGASLADIASSVRVLVLPDLPSKGDIIDWAKAGGTREKLDELIAAAAPWKPLNAEELEAETKARATAEEDKLYEELKKARREEPKWRFRKRLKDVAKELEADPRDLAEEIERRVQDEALLHPHWSVDHRNRRSRPTR